MQYMFVCFDVHFNGWVSHSRTETGHEGVTIITSAIWSGFEILCSSDAVCMHDMNVDATLLTCWGWKTTTCPSWLKILHCKNKSSSKVTDQTCQNYPKIWYTWDTKLIRFVIPSFFGCSISHVLMGFCCSDTKGWWSLSSIYTFPLRHELEFLVRHTLRHVPWLLLGLDTQLVSKPQFGQMIFVSRRVGLCRIFSRKLIRSVKLLRRLP